ncbi:30S ribosomal protein S4 [bacterium]|nr:30S ribosomal protein S4 [bacterium]
MGRYKGPSCKICRRNRLKLFLKGDRCETAKCAIEKRNFPPGPKAVVPRKISEYGRRLREKQKLRFFYGVSERQIRIYFETARRIKGVTGENLLNQFERRLDNLVYRARLATSRKEARQLVRHGHFQVNSGIVDIPSYLVKEGDLLTLNGNETPILNARFAERKDKSVPNWIVVDTQAKSIKVSHSPKREEIDVPVEEQLIVEFYSR